MVNIAWPVDLVSTEPEYSGREARQAGSVTLSGATAARPFGAISGVRPGTPSSTVELTSDTAYAIHPHAGVLDTQASALAGPYWYVVGSDGADETGSVDAQDESWPRIDILWVRMDDPAELGTDPPAVVTGYTAGTPAATPAAPDLPDARCMRLATISVPVSGGGSPTIVFDAPCTAAAGGITSFPTTAARDAAITSPFEGMAATTGTGATLVEWRYASGVWVSLSDFLATSWPPVSSQVYSGQVASGTLLATLALPAMSKATVVRISFVGQAGFNAAASSVAVLLSATAGHGTLISMASHPVYAAAASWASCVAVGTLVLPAGVASVVSLHSSSTVAAYFRGLARADRHTS
jgi:hypothetical protein